VFTSLCINDFPMVAAEPLSKRYRPLSITVTSSGSSALRNSHIYLQCPIFLIRFLLHAYPCQGAKQLRRVTAGADGPKRDRRYANAMPRSCTLILEGPSLHALLLYHLLASTSAESIVPCQARVAPPALLARLFPSCRFCRGLPTAACHMESQ
jgi:hypothetical protein